MTLHNLLSLTKDASPKSTTNKVEPLKPRATDDEFELVVNVVFSTFLDFLVFRQLLIVCILTAVHLCCEDEVLCYDVVPSSS